MYLTKKQRKRVLNISLLGGGRFYLRTPISSVEDQKVMIITCSALAHQLKSFPLCSCCHHSSVLAPLLMYPTIDHRCKVHSILVGSDVWIDLHSPCCDPPLHVLGLIHSYYFLALCNFYTLV